MGISLAAPLSPKGEFQSLPTILRRYALVPIPSCSKAPGVFSSRCRYPASSRELHFHRAHPRDSSPVVTPFVRSGTYPERNCAHICYSPFCGGCGHFCHTLYVAILNALYRYNRIKIPISTLGRDQTISFPTYMSGFGV